MLCVVFGQYLAVFGLMLVFEVLLTCYFLIPSTREKLVDDINPPAVRAFSSALYPLSPLCSEEFSPSRRGETPMLGCLGELTL